MKLVRRVGGASVLMGAVGLMVAGGAVWRALARDFEWLRHAGLGFGDREPADRRESRRQLASEHAPAPDSDDALSPGTVIRERAMESRSERLGDGTPTGPITSPPVDPERT